MSDVNIGNAENVYVKTGAGATEIASAVAALLREMSRGATKEFLEDIGHNNVPDEVDEPESAPPEEEQAVVYQSIADRVLAQEDIDATTRVDQLRNLVYHTDRARSLEGLQTSHETA